jgi:hypothetical protein
VDDGILRYNTEFRRVGFNDFELDCPHVSVHKEGVALADGPVRCISKGTMMTNTHPGRNKDSDKRQKCRR